MSIVPIGRVKLKRWYLWKYKDALEDIEIAQRHHADSIAQGHEAHRNAHSFMPTVNYKIAYQALTYSIERIS